MVEKLHGTLWDNGATVWVDGFGDEVAITSNWDTLSTKLKALLDEKFMGPPMPDATYHDILQSIRNILLLSTPENQSNNRRVRNLFNALDHAILSTEPKD